MRNPGVRLLPVLFVLLVTIHPAKAADNVWPRVHESLRKFDSCRALAMRALQNAQDLKTVSLYGREFGLDMPEAVSEDVLIEGLWLFDYLHAMDMSSMSLISYAAVEEHPHLAEELAIFSSYLPEAAAKTRAYYQKTSLMLAEAVQKVNEAAELKTPFVVEDAPTPDADMPPSIRNFCPDGFSVGWSLPVLAGHYRQMLEMYAYSPDWMLQMASEIGVNFIRSWDMNGFEWADVEKQPGEFDWSRVDEICTLLKKHNLNLLLRIPSNMESPPEWLIDQLGDGAVLVDANGKRIEVNINRLGDSYFFHEKNDTPVKYPMNMFNPRVAQLFGNYARTLIQRIRQNGVQVEMVELDGRWLPWYGGQAAEARFRAWLQENGIDPRKRWDADYTAEQAPLPDKIMTVGTDDPAKRRMALDVIRWREREYVEYFRPQVQAIRQAYPGLPITTHSAEYGEANESMDGRNDELLVRELGLVPFGFSMENIWDNLRRSYSPSHFSAAKTHSGTGDAFAQYAFSGYMHDTLMIYSLPHVRGFNWGESLFYPDLRWEFTSLLGWRRFGERAQQMGPEMRHTVPTPQAALLWSDTSSKYQSFTTDYVGGTYGFRIAPANYNKIGCIGWNRILDSIGLNHDIITERQVLAGKLADYELLVMPAAQALPAAVADRIREYANAGGKIIATSIPALYDQDMSRRQNGQLADVFGADFDAFRGRSIVAESPLIVPNTEAIAQVWGALWRPNRQKESVQSDSLRTLFCSYLPREGGTVRNRFTDGTPAVVVNSFGAGRTAVIGYPIGRESFLSNYYHQHYGNNWPDLPQGPIFQQNIFYWVERLLRDLDFRNDVVVIEEIAPRSTSYDANYPEGTWPRATQRYRDYFWQTARQSDNRRMAPRAVETILRRGPDNPNEYLVVYDREGSYGLHPGAVDLEAANREVTIELDRQNVTNVYDVNLGCAVPFEKRGRAVRLSTMVAPSSGRMLAIGNENSVRLYSGNRQQGGLTDQQLLEQVAEIQPGEYSPLSSVIIAPDAVRGFLAERAAEEIVISAEQPVYIPAAEKLAGELRAAFNCPVRITRNSPRIGYGSGGIGHRRGNVFATVEQPDIIFGNRDDSHYVAQYGAHPGRSNHTVRLPFMVSKSFPGPGRSITCLTRPFVKQWDNAFPRDDGRVPLMPADSALIVGAGDVAGLDKAVDALIKILK